MSFFVRLDFDSRQGILGRTYQKTGKEREKKRKGRWLAQRGLTLTKREKKNVFNFRILSPPPVAETHYTLAHHS